MKNVNKLKKKKGKRDLQALEDKNPWRFEVENDKKF